jgi:hypothetical protein
MNDFHLTKKKMLTNILLLFLGVGAGLGGGYLLFSSLKKKQVPSDLKALVDDYKKNQVKNTLSKKNPDYQKCYLEFLKTNPEKREGGIHIDWKISSEGKIKNLEIIFSDFQDDKFKDCMIKIIEKISFPEPHEAMGMVYIEHLFNFMDSDPSKKQKLPTVEIVK